VALFLPNFQPFDQISSYATGLPSAQTSQ